MIALAQRRVLALSGGVGGAKLALGLSRVLDAERLTIIANTGDDFQHLGLSISPDIDTLLYTLADLADPVKGWGRRDETWNFMAALEKIGGETWFRLGDADLAMHVERTRRIARGETLSSITDDLRKSLGVLARVVPMTDQVVRTRVRTDTGWLSFQDYFVRLRCEPVVREIRYDGAESAQPCPAALEALSDPDLAAVVICPSNPYLSVGPLLAMSGLREALIHCAAPIVAVSPIIAGEAVKGPTAKVMRELGVDSSAAEVARYYAGLIDAFVVDSVDATTTNAGMTPLHVAETLMISLEDRERLARNVLDIAVHIKESGIRR